MPQGMQSAWLRKNAKQCPTCRKWIERSMGVRRTMVANGGNVLWLAPLTSRAVQQDSLPLWHVVLLPVRSRSLRTVPRLSEAGKGSREKCDGMLFPLNRTVLMQAWDCNLPPASLYEGHDAERLAFYAAREAEAAEVATSAAGSLRRIEAACDALDVRRGDGCCACGQRPR